MTRYGDYKFSERSLSRLATVHPLLQMIAYEGLRQMDLTIVSGRRTIAEQQRLVSLGRSKTTHSYHVAKRLGGPAFAVDLAPWVEGGEAKERRYFYYMGGVLETLAYLLGVPVIWGGDWNSNMVFSDQSFDDLYHLQIDEKAWKTRELFNETTAKALLEQHGYGELAQRTPLV